MKLLGVRIPFTGRKKTGSRKRRYAKRAALAGAAGATYVVMRGRRTTLLRR
jgi:hypothetical protein